MTEGPTIDLTGRTAVVTGGAAGIGKAYVVALAQAGANVAIADIDVSKASEAANEISTKTGRDVVSFSLNQADGGSVLQAVQAVREYFEKIDILINNAALFSTLERKPVEHIPLEEWDDVLRVNLTGPFLCAQAIMPIMREHAYGKIINIVSTSVFSAKNQLAHYVSAKMGLLGLTRALAREFGKYGICVNALSPGPTDSGAPIASKEYLMQRVNQKSIQRIQVPDDVVGAAIFLASPMSDFITGQHLVVDGGAYFN